MFDWLFGKKPQVQVAAPVVPQEDHGPELSFNDLYKAVQEVEAGTNGVFRSANPLRQDQLERIAYAVDGLANFYYEPDSRRLTIKKPLPVAKP